MHNYVCMHVCMCVYVYMCVCVCLRVSACVFQAICCVVASSAAAKSSCGALQLLLSPVWKRLLTKKSYYVCRYGTGWGSGGSHLWGGGDLLEL